jgi:two-component system, OmpR family, alkaline phosphatase synthesis response regulator PhoP
MINVLVADDDPVTLEALVACLKSEGYQAIQARDGAEALKQWKAHKPDLCCLDIMMPKVDGYEVCRQIRAENKTVPVLFLSAKSEEIDVVVGLKLGADDFIRKPFGKHELLARIGALLRRTAAKAAAGPATFFPMGDLVVYPLELRARRKGQNIELSPREISILELLHEHAGEVVSRDALLNRCWGLDYFPESRTLDQHISRLRRRIERDPDNPVLIETIRGIGYRFKRL